jgi:hypothetical protein
MRIRLEELATFKEICRKICLNIPSSYCWQWDSGRKMAVMVLSSEDAELVFFPLFKEFSHHWNFASPAETAQPITEKVNAEYGLLPGQVFFTSHPLHNLVLCVAWWPWGSEGNISMRVGLIPVNQVRLSDGFALACLKCWLDIVPAGSSPPGDAAVKAPSD